MLKDGRDYLNQHRKESLTRNLDVVLVGSDRGRVGIFGSDVESDAPNHVSYVDLHGCSSFLRDYFWEFNEIVRSRHGPVADDFL